MITVATATFNRAHTLERLYESLQNQDCKDFEWLVINDGSTDETDFLFDQWCNIKNEFPIRYIKTQNQGKTRAINLALDLAKGNYFWGVDSDDYLCNNAISFITKAFNSLPNNNSFIGISGIKGDKYGKPLFRIPLIDSKIGYVDASNIEREKFNLQSDMAEVFYTHKLKNYKFPIWAGEKFSPEAIVWDKIALDGYKLRYYNQVIYLCEYQSDGLTNNSWQLLKDNPMGYAMLFNTQLLYKKGFRTRLKLILQFISCICLAKEYFYISNCNNKYYAYILFPFGWLLSLRRRIQFNKYI